MRNPSNLSPTTPPPLFQSKRLCLSLLYLSTALFLALHPSPTRCLFRSSPFEPLQHPLFLYPASYGERKHALPASTPHCRSPVFFPDYQEVVREFERSVSRKNTTEVGLGLRYVQGTGREQSFGGNFSFAKRVSFFDCGEDDLIVPCGFLTDLLISELDRAAMDKCRGVVVVSAVFNDHDKIRQPRGLGSETLASGCFFMFVDDVTLTSLAYHKVVDRKTQQLTRIGVWRLVRVPTENLYENPAMNGVIFKYLAHRLFVNARFSVWVDAKMQLVVDPLLLVHSLVVEKGVDLAVSKHPFFVNTMEEAVATAAWKKWRDVEGLRRQIENYCAHGLRPWSPEKLPYSSDVPDTAIILRRHGGASDLFSCLMFNELDAFNPRDQLAFAYVRDKMRPKVKMNMFEVEVFERIAVEYRHNLIKRDGGGPGPVARTNTMRAKFDSLNGSCREYLSEMWGEGGEPLDHLA